MTSPHLTSPTPRSAATPAIEALGVGRIFRGGLGWGKRVALDGVDFDIPPGLTLGLVGANGSGKTTLLRILAGVDRPTAGAVQVHGHPPTDRRVRRRLAFLPDGAPFPPELSAAAVLDLVGALGGLPKKIRRARGAELLERVGLREAGGAPLRTYSRGMHRRFGLAQAFLADPDVVLLDEPTAGLDAPGFAVLADLLGAARARAATVVLASHVASDLVDHCDELMLLGGGRVLRRGSPDALLGSADVVEMRLRGVTLDDQGRPPKDLMDQLSVAGATVVTARPARRPLAELYGDDRDGAEPR